MNVLSRIFVFAAAIISPVLIAVPADAQTMAAGASHTVVLKPDGSVWTFGNNDNGQLADNTLTNRKTPIQVSGLSDVVAVAAGGYHSLALTSTGTLYAWGDNGFGQLGDASTTDRKTPVVALISGVTAIAAGQYHSLALQSTGDLYVWGLNSNGQLGLGHTTNASTPTLAVASISALGAGFSHSLAVKTDGTAWAAGVNSNGQLGNANTTQQTSFVQMSGISGASHVAGGQYHSLVLLTNGTVKATGYNGSGQVGDGSWTQRTSPVSVSPITNIVAIAANGSHSIARESDGSLWIWGLNGHGQLGDGTTTNRNAPFELTTLSSITSAAAGHYYTIAASATGIVSTWGNNNAGQLGDGTTAARSTPAAISAANYDWKVATPVFSIASGTYNTDRTVVITVDESGATIHYTQNGAEPTEADATIASGSSVVVNVSQTLKAKAFTSLRPSSNTASATYTMKVGTPTFSPGATTYTTAQNVTIATVTPGATIRYTTDGSTPTEFSTAYTAPVSIATSTTLKAIGFKTDWSNSDLASGTYTMNFGTLTAPTMTPATGTYESSVTVEMSSSQTGAVIRYTTNGSTPTASSTIYTTPVVIDVTTTVKAKAFHPDYTTSAETSRTYTIAVAAPTFTPTSGTYAAGQTVTVSSATAGATIRYTITGVDPVDTDPTVVSGGTLVVGNYTLKAKAWKTGVTTSGVSSATYLVTGDVVTPTLAAGDSHSLAIRADGVAWGWGNNTSGQIGDGTTTTPRLLPRTIAGVTGAKAVEGGTDHSLLLRTDGTVLGFGSNANGRLGDGTTTNRSFPTAVSGLSAVSAIAAGENHSVALKTDGTLVAWGSNGFGQIGDGTTTQRLTPTAVSTVANVTAVAAGWSFTLARTQSGSLHAWGYNGNGRLGDGTTTNRSTPITVSGITTATSIAAGWDHALAVLSDGSVRAWGNNTKGQLGQGSTTDQTSPVTVTGLSNITAVAGGQWHSLALKNDGSVWAFGYNQFGQLGDASTTDRWTAVQVQGLTDIVSIAAGRLHSMALQSNGIVWVWGRNALGQLGDGTTTDHLVPYAISGPGMSWGVPPPTINLAGGTYTTEQTATITVVDASTTIRYTTDGTDPIATSPTIASGGALTIDRSLTLKANAWRAGVASAVVSAVYVLQPATPVMTPSGGVFTTAQSVAMTSSSPGVSIRYTMDGSEPTETSSLYASPVSVSTLTTLRARAFRSNWQPSVITTATYQFNYGTLTTPTVTPGSATYPSSVTVAMSAQPNESIRYTLDGSEPTEASLLYSAPFTLSAAIVVKAKAFRVDYTSSATRTVPYWVKAAPPVLTPAPGTWPAGTVITATSSTPGARVHYTIDGREPTTADAILDATAPVYVGNFTLKARAFLAGTEASDVLAATYTLTTAMSIGTVAAGSTHSIALRPDGSVLAWGYNGLSRQLGVVYCSSQGVWSSSRPLASEATAIKSVDVTNTATAAVRFDGRVVTWGANDYEQLGHAVPSSTCTSLETADRPTPREVAGLTDVATVDGGLFHFLALKADGSVWGWGFNTDGQLGNNSTTNTAIPAQTNGLTGVTMISGGQNHSLAVKSDGSVWSFGSNNWGQLGVACCGGQLTPVQVAGISFPKAIAAGWLTSYAVLADGTVRIWGAIPSGLVPGAGSYSSSPLQVPGLTGIKSIATGATATYALGEDGRVWAWGSNQYGQLGNDSTTSRYTPDLVPKLPAIRGISTAMHHAVAVAADGSLWAWGRNASGEIGDLTSGTDRLTPMVVSHAETLAPVAMTTPGTYDPSLDVARYYHTDAVGSVRVITNAAGQVVQTYDYKPFGAEWNSVTFEDKRRFTGQERDQETGLNHFGARYHHSPTARFLSVDPALNAEAAMTDPQRWNRYSYTVNRPLAMIDPDGREAGYLYLPNGRILSPYDPGFPRSAHPIRDTVGLAAAFVGGLFGAPLIDRAIATGPSIFVSLTRLFSSPASNDAFNEAARGGRHAGFLTNYAGRTAGQLQKAIRSYELEISVHLDKIQNPGKYIAGFDKLDPRHQQHLINTKWPTDIQRLREQLEILKRILEKRFE